MSTYFYSYSGSTTIDVAPNGSIFTIPATDTGTISSVICYLYITPPDEGAGPNPLLLTVDLYQTPSGGGSSNYVRLHDSSNLSLSGINYPTDRNPAYGSMNIFNGVQLLNSNWDLRVSNFSPFAQGQLISFQLTITTFDPSAVRPFIPVAPNSLTLPSYKYGIGGNIRRNDKLFFNKNGSVAAVNVLDTQKYCRFNANVEDIKITSTNTGSVGTTQLSLHRVRNGVDTVIANSAFVVPSGFSNYGIPYKVDLVDKGLLKGDIIYVSVDSISTGITNLTVQLVLNERL
jgi:hypothetical protein